MLTCTIVCTGQRAPILLILISFRTALSGLKFRLHLALRASTYTPPQSCARDNKDRVTLDLQRIFNKGCYLISLETRQRPLTNTHSDLISSGDYSTCTRLYVALICQEVAATNHETKLQTRNTRRIKRCSFPKRDDRSVE